MESRFNERSSVSRQKRQRDHFAWNIYGLKRAALRYGVDQDVVYPHSFRHLFAKNFIERNPDISLLADLMGHESIETTRIYLRRTANEQRAAVNKAINW